MIKFIKGKYISNFQNGIIIETEMGLGFYVSVPIGSPIYLNKIGDNLTVYTEMIVRENDVSLYGFHNLETLDLFNLLMTVSGVGPKAALSILSSFNTDDLKRAISIGDSQSISKANGIGKKTAERITLELKDKVDFSGEAIETKVKISNSEKDLALQALITLGYSKNEAIKALDLIQDNNLKSEEYIKLALKSLF